ncbi:hypothetical protein PUN28_009455 [Cardiocondyla obscurior]|uniref:Uncharacterized protein n=1 Tax=Cardiocondyla obscurior TaxID=286306 RepID=A0AAW2FXY8_9HYME
MFHHSARCSRVSRCFPYLSRNRTSNSLCVKVGLFQAKSAKCFNTLMARGVAKSNILQPTFFKQCIRKKSEKNNGVTFKEKVKKRKKKEKDKRCMNRSKFWHVFRNIISTLFLCNTEINLYFWRNVT